MPIISIVCLGSIPLRYASGIVPNSLWLLDSSIYSSNFAMLVFRESHYTSNISETQNSEALRTEF